MKIACILLFSGQLVALTLVVLREEMSSPESGWGDVLVALALGAYLIAGGAGVVFIVLVVPRLIRGVARVGVLPLIGSLLGVRRYEDAFEDVFDEALGLGAADERVNSSAERVARGRAGIEDELIPTSNAPVGAATAAWLRVVVMLLLWVAGSVILILIRVPDGYAVIVGWLLPLAAYLVYRRRRSAGYA